MNHYAFILGRESKLSLAEILQVLRAEEIDFTLTNFSKDIAIISTEVITPSFFHRLGGAIKLAKIRKVKEEDLLNRMDKQIREKMTENKFHVGVSVYPLTENFSRKDIQEWTGKLRKMIFEIKSCLKEEKQSFRFVESKDDQLSSVVVEKNHLADERGIEFIVFADEDQIWLGQTMTVQDFEGFSARDHARPFRDDRSGMLPPKLARTMINLAGIKIDHDTVLLDPFCGSGTVLQEAALLGAGKVLGSDLSKRAVMDTIGNLSWLKKEFGLDTNSTVEQVDVIDVSSWVPADYIDLIVTEPYLGTPVRGKLSKEDIRERQDRLSELYDQALIQFHHVLKPGGLVVMIFPYVDNSRLPIPRHLCRLFEQIIVGDDLVSTERLGIDYRRPGQHVGREIMILRKES